MIIRFIWQPLGLLTTVKPPALRERHDNRVQTRYLGFILAGSF